MVEDRQEKRNAKGLPEETGVQPAADDVFDRTFAGQDAEPGADTVAGAPRSEELAPDEYAEPFHLRMRLPAIGGVVLSVGWLALSLYAVNEQLPLSELLSLLPHELGGLAAGVLTPIALLWMVIAFYERGHQLQRETESLRWHFRRLAYPSDRAEKRVTEVSEVLRAQARELTRASEEASARAREVTEMVHRRTLELAQVSEDADLRAQAVAETLRRQTEDLQGVSDKATSRARDAGD
nr:hypothetical protein [Alphaproteobacteria bacterium]